LARQIAKILKVPAVVSTAKDLLEQNDYSWNWHGQVERFIEQNGLQTRLFDMQKEREDEHESFVTDRAGVEQAAYAIIESRQSAEKKFDLPGFLGRCRRHMKNYSLIYLIGWNGEIVDHDSAYKLAVDSVIRRLLCHWKINYITVIDTKKELNDVVEDIVESVTEKLKLSVSHELKHSREKTERSAASRKRAPDQHHRARQTKAVHRPSRSA
jgi:hypothetical protein